jgi:hypothetical protein
MGPAVHGCDRCLPLYGIAAVKGCAFFGF